MKKKLVSGIVAIALLTMVGMVLANPKLNLLGPQWRILDRITLPNGNLNFATRHPDTISGGGISFSLLDDSEGYTSYMLTNYVGDLTEKTITATVRVIATDGTTFVFRDAEGGPTPATVRLEFQRTSAGKWVETDYWWSHKASAALASLTGGPITISADTADLADWSDIYGHFASDPAYTDAFHDALAKVKEVSLSFGGGYFFANGVAVGSGSATFQLLAYTVS